MNRIKDKITELEELVDSYKMLGREVHQAICFLKCKLLHPQVMEEWQPLKFDEKKDWTQVLKFCEEVNNFKEV